MSDFRTQLFSYLPEEKIATFSCGHVIPSSNLQTLVVTQGPRRQELKFKFDSRGDIELVGPFSNVITNVLISLRHRLTS